MPARGARPIVRGRLRPADSRPLAHWTPVHVHLGAANVLGRVAVLEGAAIAPGESARVQLVLEHPIGAVRGDVFWGAGKKAADMAGRMDSRGRYWILLPKTVTVPNDRRWKWWQVVF